MNEHLTFTPAERQLRDELQTFIPDQIFDAHAHIWKARDLKLTARNSLLERMEEHSIRDWRISVEELLGKPVAGGLLFPFPVKTCDLEQANQYLIDQLAGETGSRGLVMIAPDSPIERVAELLEHDKIIGLKPYHCFSAREQSMDSAILEYIPELFWELADRHGSLIMLHIVLERSMEDPENQRQLIDLCARYPKTKCVLAHAARSFHAPSAKAVHSLRGLDNVYFDMSAICEAEAIEAILYEFGPRKLMWGSDFPISNIRGKAVTVGNGFYWMSDDTVDWGEANSRTEPVRVGLESLRALKKAAELFGLNKADIEDIFYNNSMRLTGQFANAGNQTLQRYTKAKAIIPGGTQLLSKRPELQAPGRWPAYFSESRGCEVWDLDGNHYYDMSTNGIGSCLLGYRNEVVTQAVKRRLLLGSMSTLNPPEEIELAELLLEIHPWAQQARFARSGGEACSMAVRIARAATHRSIIAVCGYHGWHDWYLAANLGQNDHLSGHLLPGLAPSGVPRELLGTTLTFRANDRQAFDEMLQRSGSRLAAVIMEPCRYNDPEPEFLKYIRDKLHEIGALLIFDEVTIGWRLHFGGAHLKFGVNPDMAVYAKALGNGHPISAVIGTTESMEGAQRSFISSTYWTESIGPVAALATLKAMKEVNVPAIVGQAGNEIAAVWKQLGEQAGLPVKTGEGYPALAKFEFIHEYAGKLKTLYTIRMLERGFLAGTVIYPTVAHTPDIVSLYTQAIREVFHELSEILRSGEITEMDVELAHEGFTRLN